MNEISPLIQALHGMAATAWIGGIFFAYMALRPAAMQSLEPPLRVKLWQSAYSHFFPWVWFFISVLLVTGYWDLFERFGGFGSDQAYLVVMHVVGLLMVIFFAYLYFGLYQKLSRHLHDKELDKAGKVLMRMRPVMATNLILGMVITAIGVAGSYY